MPASEDKSSRENETTAKVMTKTVAPMAQIDYRSGQMPKWVKEAIEEQYNIEAEDAKSAGSLGFMARVLVLATMPYNTTNFRPVSASFQQEGSQRSP
jgi:hypothetical protein